MLAMYPEYQERVYSELKSIDLSDDADIPNDVLTNLTYLEMFIKETLRLFPSVPYMTRTVLADMKLGMTFLF